MCPPRRSWSSSWTPPTSNATSISPRRSLELGYPTIIALNMVDVAEKIGQKIDAEQLAFELATPVIPLVASTGQGVRQLQEKIVELVRAKAARPAPRLFCDLPAVYQAEIAPLAATLASPEGPSPALLQAEALLVLSDEKFAGRRHGTSYSRTPPGGRRPRASAWKAPASTGAARPSRPVTPASTPFTKRVASEAGAPAETFSDKLDRIVTHKIWGMMIFIAVMALMFLSIFTFAQWPMDLLSGHVPVGRRRRGPRHAAGRSGIVVGKWRHRRRRGGRRLSPANLPACFFLSDCWRTPATWRAPRFSWIA